MSTFDQYLWFCLQIPTGNPLYESYYKQVSFTGIFLDGTKEQVTQKAQPWIERSQAWPLVPSVLWLISPSQCSGWVLPYLQLCFLNPHLSVTLLLQVDPAYTGRVGASEAALFLKKSGLSDIILGKVRLDQGWFLWPPLGPPGRWRLFYGGPSSWGWTSWVVGRPLPASQGCNCLHALIAVVTCYLGSRQEAWAL